MWVLIVFVLFGCNKYKVEYFETKESRERESLCNKILKNVSTQLKQEKNLSPFGFGGQTSNGVEMLALSFIYFQPLEIKESRELLLYCIDSFVDAVNKEERIHYYLKNSPFTSKNIQVTIYLYNPDGSNLSSGLQVISNNGGFLRYKTDNPDGPLFKTVLKETYHEALQKIASYEAEVKAQAA
jgi:hypothetical protein